MSDPATFLGGVTAILSRYPIEVMNVVTDPAIGVPAKIKFLPTLAEVREACEREYAPIAAELQRRARIEKTKQLLASPENRERRPTVEELKEKYGETYGLGALRDVFKPKPETHYRNDRPLTSEERQAMYASRKNENKGA